VDCLRPSSERSGNPARERSESRVQACGLCHADSLAKEGHLGWEDFDRVRYGYGANYQTPGFMVSKGRDAIKLLLQHTARSGSRTLRR